MPDIPKTLPKINAGPLPDVPAPEPVIPSVVTSNAMVNKVNNPIPPQVTVNPQIQVDVKIPVNPVTSIPSIKPVMNPVAAVNPITSSIKPTPLSQTTNVFPVPRVTPVMPASQPIVPNINIGEIPDPKPLQPQVENPVIPPQVTSETVVVSPSQKADVSKLVMPNFPQPVPQVVTANPVPANNSDVTPKVVNRGGGGGFIKTLLFIILGLIILGALGIGGYFAWTKLNQQEVTISYWGLWENEDTIKPIISDFETKFPKIKVNYIKNSQKQYRARVQAAIERGEGPDVFRFHNTWVPMLKNDLAPVPANIMTVADFSFTFYPVAKNSLVAGSTIYGLPLEIDGLGLYINEDLFAAAGANPPTTWDDIVRKGDGLISKLTVKDAQNNIVTSAIALGTTSNVENYSDILAVMMVQNGANLATLTGSEAEGTLLYYRAFSDPNNELYTWNSTLDNSVSAFASGRAAMILAPSWRAFDIKQINPQLKFKIVSIPQLPGNTVNWASYWVEGVSAKSKNQAAAFEFVKYLTSREGASKLYTEESKVRLFGEPYARVDLASSLTSDPYASAYISGAATAITFPLASRTFDEGLNDQLIKYLEDAVNGVISGASPTSALGTAATGFSQVLGRYGLTSSSLPTNPNR
jgi:multiple sugar transport system substrate-binding protein